MRLFHKLRRSCFAAEADKVVQIEGIKPCLDVFPSLTVLPNVFGKTGQSFGVAIRSTVFDIGRPCFDFPWRARVLAFVNTHS